MENQKSKVNKIQAVSIDVISICLILLAGISIFMSCFCQDIDKTRTEINRCKVQIETGEKMIKKLTKGIEESKKEKERLLSEKQTLMSTFKDIEVKAFTVQENYKKIQEVCIYIHSLSREGEMV